MTTPKVSVLDGNTIHISAGAIIQNDRGEILLIDRATPPYGWAGVAGHVDQGETPLQAAIREVKEETGYDLQSPKMVIDEFVDWNWCGAGVTGHQWYVYQGTVSGQPKIQEKEVKAMSWHKPSDLKKLSLEPVWKHWFEKLKYL